VNDFCLTQNEQLFSYIMPGTNYIFMRWRWWWCPLCSRLTHRVGFL